MNFLSQNKDIHKRKTLYQSELSNGSIETVKLRYRKTDDTLIIVLKKSVEVKMIKKSVKVKMINS